MVVRMRRRLRVKAWVENVSYIDAPWWCGCVAGCLDDALAERLRAQAQAHQISLEQWVVTILANASARPHAPQTWTDLSRRRLALLRKQSAATLNDPKGKPQIRAAHNGKKRT
jgi:hypothetical protein